MVDTMEYLSKPEFLIDDLSSHQNKFELFIYNSIRQVSEVLVESGKLDEFYENSNRGVPQIGWYSHINRGHCEYLLIEVLDLIRDSRFDEDRVTPVGFVNMSQDIPNHPPPPSVFHFYLEYTTEHDDTYCFDAEVPWGVPSWEHMPTLKDVSFLRRYADRIESDPRDIDFVSIYGFEYMSSEDESFEKPEFKPVDMF